MKREADLEIEKYKKEAGYWRHTLAGKEKENELFTEKIRELDGEVCDAQDLIAQLERQLARQH